MKYFAVVTAVFITTELYSKVSYLFLQHWLLAHWLPDFLNTLTASKRENCFDCTLQEFCVSQNALETDYVGIINLSLLWFMWIYRMHCTQLPTQITVYGACIQLSFLHLDELQNSNFIFILFRGSAKSLGS